MFNLNALFINILSMSTIASIVFLLILLARKILKNKINISYLSLLWILFILVLIFPINFSSKLSIKNYLQNDDIKVIDISKNIDILENSKIEIHTNDYLKSDSKSIDYINIFSYVWILIAVGSIFRDIIIYNTFRCTDNKKTISDIPEKIMQNFQSCKERLNIKKDIKLLIQDRVKTPSLHGIFNVKILITDEIFKMSDNELEYIFIHELNHYKRKHNILYLMLQIIENIYWFNPIIFIAGKLIRQDFEFITDDLVIESGVNPKEYCKVILKIAEISTVTKAPLPSICTGKDELERRIKQMKNKIVDTKYAFVSIIIVLALISLVTISLASNRVDDKIITIEVENDLSETEQQEEKLMTNMDEEYIVKESDVKEEVELIKPLEGERRISNTFGKRVHPLTGMELFHEGVDVIANQGEEVLAVADGNVIFAGFDSEKGNYVKIKHDNETTSLYAHGSKLLVKEGDKVFAGDKIMLVGSTGMATGSHLHFEMQNEEGEYIDVNQLFE